MNVDATGMGRLERLLRPRSIALIGGGAWTANVVRECRKIGFPGDIWPVHPTRAEIGGAPAFASVEALPGSPDACFVGVNRQATVEVMRQLSDRGAGGAVCFASGFREAEAEIGGGGVLEDALIEAAGETPFLGPNCYGFLNALDGVAIWPDQHGLTRVDRGVAIISQSSNIALNLTMQARGLPIGYLVTIGNQAQTGLAEIGRGVLADPRVTALGLHLEGVGDLAAFEALAAAARAHGKPIVALKVGASEQARAAVVSHTAALAGTDAGADALLDRLGIGRVTSLSALVETLMLLHVAGPLTSDRVASMSCSGGEASLMADSALDLPAGLSVAYPPLNDRQHRDLRDALGPKVSLANPLDYHTYIWGDRAALARCFAAMMDPSLALGVVVLDFPRADLCDTSDWDIVVEAIADVRAAQAVPMAILASLTETLPEATARAIMARGIVPLHGIPEALQAIAVAARIGAAWRRPPSAPLLLPSAPARDECHDVVLIGEAATKVVLADHGVEVPRSRVVASIDEAIEAADAIGYPVVLKGDGAAHKTEAGLVALDLGDATAVRAAGERMAADRFLVEEMITDGVAELIVGVVRDPAHGFVLTIGAGGVLAEILRDTRSLLVPATEPDVEAALDRLRVVPLFDGYRERPAASRSAIVRAVMALQDAVIANADRLVEIEINPLICTPARAIAADALLRSGKQESEAGHG